jgi:hypothetical protein
MGSSGCRSGRGRASTSTTSLPALRRHYRVCPQWLVVGSRAGPVGVVGGMRGARAPATRRGRLRIWLRLWASEEAFETRARGWGPERAPGLGLGDQIVRAGVASGVRGHRGDSGLTSPPGGGEACARLRASCVDRAPGGARTARISLAGACRSGRQRAVVGRSQRRRSRDPLGA